MQAVIFLEFLQPNIDTTACGCKVRDADYDWDVAALTDPVRTSQTFRGSFQSETQL